MCVCVCHRWVLKVWDICFLSFFKIFCTVRQILVVRTFFCDFDGSKCFWRRLKVPWNAYETLIQLILASGAWSPPQAHLAFRFFTIYRKFCDPSLKKRFPRKDVNTWPGTPPKKVNGAYFFQARTFLVFSSIYALFEISVDIENSIVLDFMQMQIFQNSQTSKIGDFENLSTLWAKFLNPPIFEVF